MRVIGGARTGIEALAIFAGCTLGFFWLMQQAGPYVPDVDTLYHYKVARLIREQGPWVDISWLPFTVLGDHGPDHHWLFHALIAPLTLFGNDHRSINLVAAMVAAAMPAAIYPFLRRAGIPFAALFAVAMMFSSEDLPFRFLLLRAQDLAVVFMVAALFCMAWRKPIWVGVIAFLFTQAYHGAAILGLLLAATLGVQWLHERKVFFPLVTAVAVGVFAGLLASPWFPQNIRYLIFHTVFKTTSVSPLLIGVEWLPPIAKLLVNANVVAHGMFVAGLVAALVTRPARALARLGQDTIVACVLTLVFLAMNAMAWRFVEYYAPFAVLSAGLLWRDALRQRTPGRFARAALPTLLVAALAWGMVKGANTVREGAGARYDGVADFMRHIDAHDPNPIVFNTRWSDFQQMVFWSERARYVAGLDGNYLLYGADPRHFRVWFDISSGARANRDDNAALIRDTFGAGWVVVSFLQGNIAESLSRDPDAHLVMERPYEGWLFAIKPRGR